MSYGGRDPFAEQAILAWREDPPPAAAAGETAEGMSEDDLPADVYAALVDPAAALWDDPLVMALASTHILDVIEGIGGLFHEHQSDILAWPFKTFCAKWRRLIAQGAKRRWDDDTRDEERARQEEQRRLQDAHRQQWGSG